MLTHSWALPDQSYWVSSVSSSFSSQTEGVPWPHMDISQDSDEKWKVSQEISATYCLNVIKPGLAIVPNVTSAVLNGLFFTGNGAEKQR